ncbi:MAG: DUF4190 domain-containing protein [Acidimicrobiales bacterium]
MSDQPKFCSTCGTATEGNEAFCGSCGASLGEATEPSVAQPESLAPQPANAGIQRTPGTNTKAIWALVLSIAGVLLFITGPVAVWLGGVAKKEIAISGQGGNGLATAGVIIGIIVTVLGIINLVLVVGN